jgi:hypothetical protein
MILEESHEITAPSLPLSIGYAAGAPLPLPAAIPADSP